MLRDPQATNYSCQLADFNGVPTQTSVISTIVSSTTGTSSTTSSSSTDDGGGGPIGYTTSTPGQVGPTTYVYTTTDQFGSKTLVTAVFTPTYEPTSPYPSVTSGTIIALSDFTSIYSQTSKGAAKRSITPVWGDMQMGIFVAGATVLGVIIGGLHVAA